MATALQQIIDTLISVLHSSSKTINLHEPTLNGAEWQYVKDCIDTGWVSSVGSYVDRFEQNLAKYTGHNYAIATTNGTSALHACLHVAQVQQNDEVLIPTLTFVATANAVSYCGAIPHFVDSNPSNLGIHIPKLRNYLSKTTKLHKQQCINKTTGRPIKALIAMHSFGHPVELDELSTLCQEFHLTLIEDAAEALGSLYRGQHVGHKGLMSILSFNGNKIVTTGGGGAILTNDESLAHLAKHITSTAKIPHAWQITHDQIGFNYRMPNINAALGCAQLEQLPSFIEKKRKLAEIYRQTFTDLPYAAIFIEPEYAKSNYWLNLLMLDKNYLHLKDELLAQSHQFGIAIRPAWTLMHHLPMYCSMPRMDVSIAEELSKRIICLPSSVNLLDKINNQ